MRCILLTVLALGILASSAAGQTRLTQSDLLRRIIDLDRLTTPPPAGEVTGMFSSYDRRSRIDDEGNKIAWRANADAGHFLRTEEDGWNVMAEMAGPGAITRIWSANPHGQIRFILDGEAVIDADFGKLMSGELAPFVAPFCFRGLNNYFPIGYSESCKVVSRKSGSYYHINYVQFAPRTQVERFSFEVDEATQQTMELVARALVRGLNDEQIHRGRRTMPVAVHKTLGPADKLTETVDGDGTLRALYIALTDRTDPREPYALHRCILRIWFDGAEKPAVEAPLVDFFGSGFDLVRFRSLPIGTERRLELPLPDRHIGYDTFMYCYFPMPFHDGLRVEIENLNESRKPIGLMLYMRVDTQRPERGALRFHARFRKEDPTTVFDYPILEATGTGRLVGCALNVDCPRRMWWGEGDEKIWRDGEAFPSYFGTGSEDYLGDAWGLHEFIHGLCGVTRAAPYGKNAAYRWHVPDVVNFRASIRFTIENWQHGNAKDTYYSTIAYWYAARGSTDFFEPLARGDVNPPGLRIPGSVEIEGHILGSDWGNLVKQVYAGGAEYSGEQAASISTEAPVNMLIPADRERVVRLSLRTHPDRPFRTVTVRAADGRTVGVVAYDRAAHGMYPVGVLHLTKGNNEVTVQCDDAVIMDCWVLEDVRSNPNGPEAETLEVERTDGVTTRKEYGRLDWSAGGQLVMDFDQLGSTITLTLPPRPNVGSILPRLHVSTGPEGGCFQALLDGKPIGSPFDTHSAQPQVRPIALEPAPFGPGAHTLGFRAVAGGAGSGRRLGLDTVDLASVFSRHAIECETLPVVAFEDSHHGYQHIHGASGTGHLWCRPTERGAWVELKVPVGDPGRYHVRLVLTKSFDYGIVRASLDGTPVGEPLGTYAPRVEPGAVLDLGTHELAPPAVRLRAEVIGKQDQSRGCFFGLDCVELKPVDR